MMPQGAEDRSGASADSVLRHVVTTLVRSGWIVLVCLAITLLAAVAWLAWADPVYRAETTVIVDTDRRAGGAMDLVGLGAYRDVLVEVEVLRSLDMARRVASRLEGIRAESSPSIASWPIFRTDEPGGMTTATLARAIQDQIEVDQVRREVGVIRIGVRSSLPEEARRIADLYAEEYARRNLDASRSDAALLKTFLDEQMDSRSAELATTEAAIQAFQETENAVPLDREADQLASRLADLQSLEDQAQVEYDMVQAQLAALRREAERIEPNLYGRVASGLETSIAALQQDIADREVAVETKYARNPGLRDDPSADPELVRDIATLAGLRTEVNQRAREYVDEVMSTGGIDPTVVGRLGQGASVPGALANISRLRTDITEKTIEASGLKARLSVLQSRIRRYEQDFERIPRQTRELASLERARRSGETTYEWLQQRYEEARVAEQSEFGYVRVLDTADTPIDPVAPRPVYTLALAIMLGLIVGLLIVFGRETLDDRPRRAEDFNRMGLQVAGVLPAAHSALDRGDGSPSNPRGRAETAAAYVRIATLLDLGAGITGPPQLILVSSVAPGPDSAAVAANLAMAYAQSGQRTLLLELDADSPSVHGRLGLPSAPGVSNVLLEGRLARDAVFAAPGSGFYVMPFGDLDVGSRLFPPIDQAAALLTYLRRSFARIVIDAGSIMPSTRMVAMVPHVDSVLLVAEAGHTRTAEIEEVRGLMARAGTRSVHTVLSPAPPRRWVTEARRAPRSHFERALLRPAPTPV